MAEFYETRMGRVFFEGTMPRIAAALAEIAGELKRGNDRHPVHPLEAPDAPQRAGTPLDATSHETTLNFFQQLAVDGYEGGVFKGLVNSLQDAEGLNAPLFELILAQLSTEHTRGEKGRAIEKINAMLQALQQVRDTLESV